ncbi:hypothetical protein CBL_07538 [Carabus blaptoides fortunei]
MYAVFKDTAPQSEIPCVRTHRNGKHMDEAGYRNHRPQTNKQSVKYLRSQRRYGVGASDVGIWVNICSESGRQERRIIVPMRASVALARVPTLPYATNTTPPPILLVRTKGDGSVHVSTSTECPEVYVRVARVSLHIARGHSSIVTMKHACYQVDNGVVCRLLSYFFELLR